MLLMNITYAMPEQIQLTHCLEKKLLVSHKIISENKNFKIIELESFDLKQVAVQAAKNNCGSFKNVTHLLKQKNKYLMAQQLLANKKSLLKASDDDIKISHSKIVTSALAKVNAANIMNFVKDFSSFYNRSALSQYGVSAAYDISARFEKMAKLANRDDYEINFVATGRYMQPSVVVKFGKNLTTPGVVIGAHIDTFDGDMPGAGDDASGSGSVLEAARVILNSQHGLKNPIYFIWYAAEERGLVGSQFVVKFFRNNHKSVKAVLQLDMTGYRHQASDKTMWLFDDYTDKKLTVFLAKLIKHYIKVPISHSKCGYGCSDHASWMEGGIPAAFPCETSFENHNKFIHTAQDTIALLNSEHMKNFAMLATAFALELSLE